MRLALMLGQRQQRGIPRIRPQPRSIVDRKAEIIADLRTGNPLRLILMEARRPFARRIELCPCRQACQNCGESGRRDNCSHTLFLFTTGISICQFRRTGRRGPFPRAAPLRSRFAKPSGGTANSAPAALRGRSPALQGARSAHRAEGPVPSSALRTGPARRSLPTCPSSDPGSTSA